VKVKQHSAGWNVGIVSKFADVKEAAELLIHNKFYKSGQNLDNVDIIYVDKAVYNTFIIESKNALYKFYTSLGQKNLNYGTMSSKVEFNRVLELLNDPHLDSSNYLTSVFHSAENLRINPVLILNPSESSEIMQNKIYGPILPIVTFEDPLEIKDKINSNEHVENLYYFGENSRLFPEVKTVFKYQNLFFNGTNFGVLGSGLGPDYGRDGTMENGLGGRYGLWTFSKQRIFMNPGGISAYFNGGAQKDFVKGKFSNSKSGLRG
jgi:aldehyde dehydrogenase (NAD+)